MIKFLIFVFLGIALAYPPTLTDEQEWEKFKVEQHKLYESQEEETYRFKVFQDNLQEIREHNKKYEKGESSYKKGINQFTDLTSEEFKKMIGRGILPPKEKIEKNVHYE